jgi:multimeric flavodoxin WrbA
VKRVTAFVGSARRKHTYNAAVRLLEDIQSRNDSEFDVEIVRLGEHHLEICRGCKACCDHGEELCPLEDDRDLLIGKMMASDGVVFATPNYSFQVSGHMKIFLDRLGFVFHRPRFFGKAYTSIVAQGVYGGKKIVDYLDFVGKGLGFNTAEGCCITTLEPMTDKREQKIDRALEALGRRYHAVLEGPRYPSPSVMDLMIFRMSRTRMKLMLDESYRDYVYYRDKGWFESDFYYATRLGPLKRAAGLLFDAASTMMTRASK